MPTSRLLVPALLVLAAGCGGGGGGGSGGGAAGAVIAENEPNDTPSTAGLITLDRMGRGRLPSGADVDFWKVALGAGDVVSIEVLAQRFDQGDWTLGANAAKLTVLDTDGASVLLQQGSLGFAWSPEQDSDVHFFMAPQAGTYYLRLEVDLVLSTGGDYLIGVSPASVVAPLQFEAEPAGVSGLNDDDLSAEPIAPGTLAGHFVDDELDWFQFSIAGPTLVEFTMYAHRNGVWQGDDGHYDSMVSLIDGDGATMLASNDDSYYYDSSIHYLLTSPGTHFLEVAECCGTGDSAYFLEFSATELASLVVVPELEPNDSIGAAQGIQFDDLVQGSTAFGDDDYYSFACNAGDRILVEVFDRDNLETALDDVTVSIRDALSNVLPDDAGGELQIRRTILTSPGTYHVQVSSFGTTDYALRVTRVPSLFESEPNDSPASGGSFDSSGRAAGVIATPGDADLFAFPATRRVPVILSCLADDVGPNGFPALDGFGSDLDPILSVRDAGGTILASSDSTGGTAVGVLDGLASVTLAFLPPADGTYYAEVVDQAGASGANFHYVLLKR